MKDLIDIKKFRYVNASEYCVTIFDGTHESPKPQSHGNHKLITSQNISSGTINQSSAYYISDIDYFSIQKRSATKKGDLLFSMIGTVGITCIIDETPNFAIKNMGCFRCYNEEDTYWLYYYFNSSLGKANIASLMKGSIQKYITLEMLQNFPILEKPENYKIILELMKNIDSQISRNKGMVQKLPFFNQPLDFSAKGGINYVC